MPPIWAPPLNSPSEAVLRYAALCCHGGACRLALRMALLTMPLHQRWLPWHLSTMLNPHACNSMASQVGGHHVRRQARPAVHRHERHPVRSW